MTRWYQNAVINGEVMPAQRRRDTSQKRWTELLEPLIPTDGAGRLFLELGCNAGYYLRKASELGYTTLGVEREQVYYDQAQYWEAQEPRGVRVEFGDINEYTIPANFITLLANVHYWMTPEQVDALVKKMRARSLNVLVVSRHRKDPRHKSDCTTDKAIDLFVEWKAIKYLNNDKHWSLLFHNPDLIEYDVRNLYNIQPFTRSKRFLPAFQEFIDIVLSRRRFNLSSTAYWQYARWRCWRKKEANLRRLRHMILLAKRDGITDPPVVRPDGLMVDGNHRLIIAERLGLPRIICKVQSST